MTKGKIATLSNVPGEKRRRLLFVEEYLKDYNATMAAIRAGYARENAAQIANTVLRDSWVKEQIDLRSRDRLKLNDITPERILMELARIAFADPRQTVKQIEVTSVDGERVKVNVGRDLAEIEEDTARALKEVGQDVLGNRVYKFADKTGALTVLAKMQGLLVEKKQIEAKVTVSSVDSDIDPDAFLADVVARSALEGEIVDPDGAGEASEGEAGDALESD